MLTVAVARYEPFIREDVGAALNRDAAKGAIDGCSAGLGDGVVAMAKVDGVVATGAVLEDASGAVQRDVIVASAHSDCTFATDVNAVIAIAGYDGAAAVYLDALVGAARNADVVAHWSSPCSGALSLLEACWVSWKR